MKVQSVSGMIIMIAFLITSLCAFGLRCRVKHLFFFGIVSLCCCGYFSTSKQSNWPAASRFLLLLVVNPPLREAADSSLLLPGTDFARGFKLPGFQSRPKKMVCSEWPSS